MIDLRNEEILHHFCYHFKTIGDISIFREDEDSVFEICESIGKIGNLLVERGFESKTEETETCYLEKIGVAAAKKGMKDATWQAVDSLEKIGVAAIEERLDVATEGVVDSLGEVGVVAAKKGMEDATWRAVDSLEKVGIRAAEKELKDATFLAVGALCVFGTIPLQMGKNIDDLIKSLNAMYNALPEMVEEGIKNYESDLKEECDNSYLKAFQEFRNQLDFLKEKS